MVVVFTLYWLEIHGNHGRIMAKTYFLCNRVIVCFNAKPLFLRKNVVMFHDHIRQNMLNHAWILPFTQGIQLYITPH